MTNLIKNQYSKSKIIGILLAIVLIPLIILFFFKDTLMTLLAASGNKAIKDAEKRDQGLKQEIDALNDKANEHVSTSNKLEQQVSEIEDDVNWHKKGFSKILALLMALAFVMIGFGLFVSYQSRYPVALEGQCIEVPEDSVTYIITKNNWLEATSDGLMFTPGYTYTMPFRDIPFLYFRTVRHHVVDECF